MSKRRVLGWTSPYWTVARVVLMLIYPRGIRPLLRNIRYLLYQFSSIQRLPSLVAYFPDIETINNPSDPDSSDTILVVAFSLRYVIFDNVRSIEALL